MRPQPGPTLEQFRVRDSDWGTTEADGMRGVFRIPAAPRTYLICVAEPGIEHGWEHVSVTVGHENESLIRQVSHRDITQREMQAVRRLFFIDTELAYEFWLPGNYAPFARWTRHLWRRLGNATTKLPSRELVDNGLALLRKFNRQRSVAA